MWTEFFFAALLACAFLYLPGYFLLRAFALRHIVSFAAAPLVSVAVFAVMSVVCSVCGLSCSWLSLVLPPVAMGLLAVVVRVVLGKTEMSDYGYPPLSGKRSSRFDGFCLGLYLLVGIALGLYIFVYNLDGPASVLQEYDNVFHLGVLRGFLETGQFSFLGVSMYPSAADAAINPTPSSGLSFYPAAWHIVVALVAETAQTPLAIAVNAVNFVLIGVAFPSSMFLLLRRVFYRLPVMIALGSFCAVAFADFPWSFLVFGPLYPNLLSLVLFPAFCAVFISLFTEGLSGRCRLAGALLVVMGGVALALSQPNAIFTAIVFLTPFCVYRLFSFVMDRRGGGDGARRLAVASGVAFSVAVLLLWAILYFLPFFQQGVLTDTWGSFTSQRQAIMNVVFVSYRISSAQPLLGVLVIIGVAYTIRHRRYLWLSCSYAFMAFMYVLDASFDGPLKHFLTGFWYSDSFRIAANLAIFAIPLASLGLYVCYNGVVRAVEKLCQKHFFETHGARFAAIAVCVLFLAGNYYPNFEVRGFADIHTAFGSLGDNIERGNLADGVKTLDKDEEQFVQKVKNAVPEGALIINEPNDGSGFAYGLDGLNLYFRYMRGYGQENETQDSRIIREQLVSIASNSEVKAAVSNIGAEYLLLLDAIGYESVKPRNYLLSYDSSEWTGIETINDDTPGFQLVLSEGDMRLYKIVA